MRGEDYLGDTGTLNADTRRIIVVCQIIVKQTAIHRMRGFMFAAIIKRGSNDRVE
jgi:hypothetical protein